MLLSDFIYSNINFLSRYRTIFVTCDWLLLLYSIICISNIFCISQSTLTTKHKNEFESTQLSVLNECLGAWQNECDLGKQYNLMVHSSFDDMIISGKASFILSELLCDCCLTPGDQLLTTSGGGDYYFFNVS